MSANPQRRNMTKGQQAMLLAMVHPEPEKGGRGRFKERVEETSTDFSAQRLQQARFVLRMGPDDLVPAVIAGSKKLDEALSEARKRQQSASSEEAQIRRLRPLLTCPTNGR